jgi:hypothetical protein
MANSQQVADMTVTEAVKYGPPLTLGFATILGYPLEWWIQVLTIIWLALLVGEKLLSTGRRVHAWRAARRGPK